MKKVTYDPKTKRVRVSQTFDQSRNRTKPQFARDLDMNVIIARYQKGIAPPPGRPGIYRDNSLLPEDYVGAMNLVVRAQQDFLALPAKVRDRFQNSPEQLMRFLQDPKNLAEAEALGIVDVQRNSPAPAAPENQPSPDPAPEPEPKPKKK